MSTCTRSQIHALAGEATAAFRIGDEDHYRNLIAEAEHYCRDIGADLEPFLKQAGLHQAILEQMPACLPGNGKRIGRLYRMLLGFVNPEEAAKMVADTFAQAAMQSSYYRRQKLFKAAYRNVGGTRALAAFKRHGVTVHVPCRLRSSSRVSMLNAVMGSNLP